LLLLVINLNILIEGHTVKVVNEKSNIQLSNDRANSLKKYFIGQESKKNRITTEGFGWSNPAYPYQKGQIKNMPNRRLEIILHLIKLNYKILKNK
jgi:outer membrane protein OmpA-like peptidoglycan-associated protein